MARAAQALHHRPEVAGVSLSHPDRVLFPAVGVTKLGLARYYERIADPWEDYWTTQQRLPAGALRALDRV
jgi:DNA primase